MRGRWGLFALGLALILAGSLLAHAIQTAGGVKVSDIRFGAGRGVVMSGLLYVPPGADAAHPAPAVLVSHGYINTREMQSPFAIELARRGFVVLAMDMTGHGGSGGAVGSLGFGGPAALAWLKSLPVVDDANVGLEGHSMGGGPILAAAQSDPQGYRSVVLEGSTPAMLGQGPEGTTTFPRNMAVVFGRYDEFSALMWQVPKGSYVPASERLRRMFGVGFLVAPGKVYGDLDRGTARVLYVPPVTHPMEHFSSAGVGFAVDWFQRTLSGEASPRPPADQIWIWKDVGTGIGFVGFIALVVGTFELLLKAPPLRPLVQPGEGLALSRSPSWWLSFGLTAAIPAATYLPVMKLGAALLPNLVFPQYVHNQLLAWALANAFMTLAFGFVLRAGQPNFAGDWVRSALIAAGSVGMGYFALILVDAVFKVDFRFWVLGLKPLTPTRAVYAAIYLVPWTIYFLVALKVLSASLTVKGEGAVIQYAVAAAAMCGGFVVLLAAEYGWMLLTGRLLTPSEPLSVIIAIQFVPLLGAIGLISAFTWRRTNSHMPGAFICALLVSWYISSGTAMHWTPQFHPVAPGAARTK